MACADEGTASTENHAGDGGGRHCGSPLTRSTNKKRHKRAPRTNELMYFLLRCAHSAGLTTNIAECVSP